MRSIKGYCMRRARREVYKAFRNVNRNNTHIEYKPKEKIEREDIPIIIAWFICPILAIVMMSQI